MGEIFTEAFILGLLATTIRSAAPLLLAALGESFSQRSGVINVGLEGYLLMGAFGGYLTSHYTNNAWLGAVGGVLAGAAVALLAAYVMISRRADQIVTGLAVWILATGIVGVVYRIIFRGEGSSQASRVAVENFSAWDIPGLSDIPWIGQILFQQVPLVYLALLAVPIALLVLRSRVGLKVRATGEHPEAVESAGGNVIRIRYLCVVATGALSGLGGAYLSIGQTDTFEEALVGGRGFIALGVAIVGRRHPVGALGAALIFALADSLQLWLPTAGVDIPQQLLAMLPYVVTIIALAGVLGHVRHPRAFLQPFVRQA
jgi:simple sugar transport system permease protein